MDLIDIPQNRLLPWSVARAFIEAKIVDASECFVLVDPEPADLLDVLEASQSQAAQSLIVYLCSHGLFPFGSHYRLATSRTTRRDEVGGRALVLADVQRIMASSSAIDKLLIVDACYSGQTYGALEQTVLGPPEVRPSETSLLVSSSPIDRADLDEGGRPAFTVALVESIRELQARAKPIFSPKALFEVLEPKTRAGGYSQPQLVAVNKAASRKFDRRGRGEIGLLRDKNVAPHVTILYVEDEAAWATPFSDSVTRPNVVVDVVPNANDAREAMQRYNYDLVLLDIFLGPYPATDLIDVVESHAPDSTVYLVTSLGKGGEDSWSLLSSLFRDPSPIDAVYFKNENAHAEAAIAYAEETLAARERVIDRSPGALAAAAQVATRAVAALRRTHDPGHAGEDFAAAAHERLAWECLALIHELFDPWLDTLEQDSQIVEELRIELFGGGRSSCSVFSVRPVLSDFDDPVVGDLILKIGPRDEIDEEVDRYDNYVQVGIPFSIRTDKVRTASTSNLGAVLYSLLGGDAEDVRELGEADDETVFNGISKIMDPRVRKWYGAKSRSRTTMLNYYGSIGFPYERVKSTIEAINAELKTFSAPLAERSVARNVLDHAALCVETPTVMVHGDMHLGNIVEYGGSFGIIDYRNVGNGPRLVDFSTLELACWLKGVTPELSRETLIRDFMNGWYLACRATRLLPRTADLKGINAALREAQAEDLNVPEWLHARVRLVLLCRRAALAHFPDATETEFAAQSLLASVRRWDFKSAWASADERRALRSAPIAFAVASSELLMKAAGELD